MAKSGRDENRPRVASTVTLPRSFLVKWQGIVGDTDYARRYSMTSYAENTEDLKEEFNEANETGWSVTR